MPVYKFWEYRVKKEVKRSIRAGMANEDLELIVMDKSWITNPPKHISWKHSKEFIKNGVYFDIVRTEEIDGKLHMHCYKDTEETAISIGLKKHTQDYIATNSTKKETKSHITTFFTKLYWHPYKEDGAKLAFEVINWPPFSEQVLSFQISNLTPPPEIV